MEKSAKQQNNDNTLSLPVLTVRGLVFFPGMMLQFDVSKERSINAINYAVSQKRLLFITSQIDITD